MLPRNILLGFLVLICGCTKEPEKDYSVWLDRKNTLRFEGRISAGSFNKLKSLYNSSNIKPSIIRIKSSGGDGKAGLDMGEWIHNTGISVRVKDYCASACANYVFLSAGSKYLDESAVLIWHGGLNQKNLMENVESALSDTYQRSSHEASININSSKGDSSQDTCPWDNALVDAMQEEDRKTFIRTAMKKCLEHLGKREKDFFVMLGIDPNLPYYGQQGDYIPQYQSKKHKGFDYSLDDLKEMGVKNIVVKGSNWSPEKNKAYREGNIYRVKLTIPITNNKRDSY
ncbi:hypothetical protein [Cellvibrio sp. PSBB023]|uniref:hypothetical protein n=1 Tax=Cellvibrio sp. PSBB023 TaxID=1945512 RepID=UPI00098FA02D|nr:hypothetical protein [Cellvibrio sp. PSBB023]AQT62084.1 hypothetical protein B0D95_19695 [Cellvibrio sp. PSBB023]